MIFSTHTSVRSLLFCNIYPIYHGVRGDHHRPNVLRGGDPLLFEDRWLSRQWPTVDGGRRGFRSVWQGTRRPS